MSGEGVRGGEVGIMEFDLTAFTLAPTVEVFNRCRIFFFVLIAEFFDIQIQRDAIKQVLNLLTSAPPYWESQLKMTNLKW